MLSVYLYSYSYDSFHLFKCLIPVSVVQPVYCLPVVQLAARYRAIRSCLQHIFIRTLISLSLC